MASLLILKDATDVWSNLRNNVRLASTYILNFQKKLKTYLFNQAILTETACLIINKLIWYWLQFSLATGLEL